MDIGLSAEEESETFKLVLHRTVDELCQYTAINGPLEPTAGFPPAAFSRSFVASLTEVTWSMLENWSKDVEAFAQHAKRSTVSVNDVRLLARRSSTLAARLDDVVEQETHHVGAAGCGTSTATKSKGKSSKSKPPPAVIYAKQPSIGEYDEDTFAPAPVKAVIDEYPTQEKGGGVGKMKCQKLVDRTSPVYIIDDDGIEDLYRPSVKPYSYKPISSAYPRQQHQQQYQKTNPASAASTALVDDDLDAALCALSDAELSKICEKPKKAAPVVSPAPAVVYDSDEDLWGKEDTGGGGWGQGSFGLRKETDQSKKMGNLGSFGMWEEEKDVVSTSSGRLRQGSGRETAWNNGKADDDDWMMECQAIPPYQQTSASGRDTQRKFTFRPI